MNEDAKIGFRNLTKLGVTLEIPLSNGFLTIEKIAPNNFKFSASDDSKEPVYLNKEGVRKALERFYPATVH